MNLASQPLFLVANSKGRGSFRDNSSKEIIWIPESRNSCWRSQITFENRTTSQQIWKYRINLPTIFCFTKMKHLPVGLPTTPKIPIPLRWHGWSVENLHKFIHENHTFTSPKGSWGLFGCPKKGNTYMYIIYIYTYVYLGITGIQCIGMTLRKKSMFLEGFLASSLISDDFCWILICWSFFPMNSTERIENWNLIGKVYSVWKRIP